MFKVKYVDSIMMLVRLDLNPIVSLFQHKCEVSETVLLLLYLFWSCFLREEAPPEYDTAYLMLPS